MSARPERPLGEVDDRVSREPTLAAEGWRRLGYGDANDWWSWLHEPSRRSVCVQPDAAGKWFVYATRHDEAGNPSGALCSYLQCGGNCEECRGASATLGPFALLGEALRTARAVRKSIVDERPISAWTDQLALFAESEPGDATGGAR